MSIEKKFDFKDLFFSITDKKGIIQFANDIFVKLSEYTAEELSKKPHKIVRNLEMPKAVFKIFWDQLKNNDIIIAYVRNKTKTGKYYDVLALAFGFGEHYISIRLKPSTQYLQRFLQLYSKQLEFENECKDMDVCVKNLADMVFQEFGMDFHSLMKQVLVQEIISLQKNVQGLNTKNLLKEDIVCNNFDRILIGVDQATKISQELLDIFNEINFVTKNLIISAVNNGEDNQTISTISMNLDELNQQIKEGSENFNLIFERFHVAINDSLALFAMMIFQYKILKTKADAHFGEEFQMSSESALELLKQSINYYVKEFEIKLADFTKKLNHEIVQMNTSLDDFKRICLGVNVICITGKIEAAYLKSGEHTQDIHFHIVEMREKNKQVHAILKELTDLNSHFLFFSESLLKDFKHFN